MAVVPRGTSRWEGKATARQVPTLQCVQTPVQSQPDPTGRSSAQAASWLGWMSALGEASHGPAGAWPPLTLPTGWAAAPGREEGEREVSGL